MPLTDTERRKLIDTYGEGPERLRSAIESVPEEARKWRPGEGKWSAHQIVCHCADAETNASMRVRYLLGEKDPVIQAYDQDAWAKALRYDDFPLEPSLEVVRATRTHTANLLRTLMPDDWAKTGRHSESGSWNVDKWLTIYAEHVHNHAKQIERNVAAWTAARQYPPGRRLANSRLNGGHDDRRADRRALIRRRIGATERRPPPLLARSRRRSPADARDRRSARRRMLRLDPFLKHENVFRIPRRGTTIRRRAEGSGRFKV